MSKKHFDKRAKKSGRSSGVLVTDPIMGDKVSPKMLAARKNNHPEKYSK